MAALKIRGKTGTRLGNVEDDHCKFNPTHVRRRTINYVYVLASAKGNFGLLHLEKSSHTTESKGC